MKPRATQRLSYEEGAPRQYRIDEKMDITPQKPVEGRKWVSAAYYSRNCRGGVGELLPFISVIRSARWRALAWRWMMLARGEGDKMFIGIEDREGL
jgi:hypothetical protein